MRLLFRGNDGKIGFKNIAKKEEIPPYAILSHRWVDGEPTYQDFKEGTAQNEKGYQKVIFCQQQAEKDGLVFFWVDSVCIDKTSSAELAEALNSFFQWYQNAEKCYVYMDDVPMTRLGFEDSMWFTRGWTLQELIAPATVEFYTPDGALIGTKKSLEEEISEITNIPREGLDARNLHVFSVEEKFSWAKKRITTREEDKTYCLLGLLGIFMPILYGEGENAFVRLRREIRLQAQEQRRPLDAMTLQTLPATPPTTPPTENRPMIQGEALEDVKTALYNKDVEERHASIETFTSTWLFEHQAFRIWEAATATSAQKDHLLTLRGNSGTGKSVLLKEASTRAEVKGLLVLYHHFDRPLQGQATLCREQMQEFCSDLLGQLLKRTKSASWPFVDTWGRLLRARPGEIPWTVRQLQDAIRDIITGYECENARIEIYIDALEHTCFDASGVIAARSPILDFITGLLLSAREAKVDLRVCIARQHYPSFHEVEPETLEIIMEDHNTGDLRAFVLRELKKVPSAGIRYILKHEIIRRCGNDFLWATQIINRVLSMVGSEEEKQVLRLVDELPCRHRELYERTFSAKNFLDQPDTLRIIQLVSGAREPLSADQFRHGFAFSKDFAHDTIRDWENSDPCFRDGGRFANFLRRESRGLVKVHRDRKSGETVRFTHGSVDTFLRDPNNGLFDKEMPWTEGCQLFLLEASFRSLSFSNLKELEANSFVEYASKNWIHHTRDCKDLLTKLYGPPDFITKKCSSTKAKRIIERQIAALKESGDRSSGHLEDEKSLLVLLASTGCTGLLKRHLPGCSVCQKACSPFDERFRNAVHNALIGHWAETAMYLLSLPTDLSAGIEVRHKDGFTFLYRAILCEHPKVVDFLLSHNADPLVYCPMEGSEFALHLAIDIAAKDTVTALLHHGRQKEQFQLRRRSPDCPGSTALHRALKSEQPKEKKLTILALLLEMAPTGIGVLELQDGKGVSVRALAEQMVSDDYPDADDMLELIEDFEGDE